MATQTTTTPTPGNPVESELIEYILTYRQNRVLQHINFKHRGPWKDAKEMAEKYCTMQNFSFVNIEYMFQRIDKIVAKEKVQDDSHIVRGIAWAPTKAELGEVK